MEMTEKDLVEKLNKLAEQKSEVIKNGHYERAAQIRDEIRKYTEELEELMNKKNN